MARQPCIPCGGKRRMGTREAAQVEAKREYVDPTRALFAAAKPMYEVVPHAKSGTTTRGKRFSTLAAAQDYARRTGGVMRSI